MLPTFVSMASAIADSSEFLLSVGRSASRAAALRARFSFSRVGRGRWTVVAILRFPVLRWEIGSNLTLDSPVDGALVTPVDNGHVHSGFTGDLRSSQL